MRALPATTADDVVACQRADNWARFSCTDKNSHREASSHGLLLCETAKKRCRKWASAVGGAPLYRATTTQGNLQQTSRPATE